MKATWGKYTLASAKAFCRELDGDLFRPSGTDNLYFASTIVRDIWKITGYVSDSYIISILLFTVIALLICQFESAMTKESGIFIFSQINFCICYQRPPLLIITAHNWFLHCCAPKVNFTPKLSVIFSFWFGVEQLCIDFQLYFS